MRVEYRFELSEVEIPRFAVEAVEGIGKLFTLATLVLNILAVKPRVEIVFHGLNPEDPSRKIGALRRIFAALEGEVRVSMEEGAGGQIPHSSSYFLWLAVERIALPEQPGAD